MGTLQLVWSYFQYAKFLINLTNMKKIMISKSWQNINVCYHPSTSNTSIHHVHQYIMHVMNLFHHLHHSSSSSVVKTVQKHHMIYIWHMICTWALTRHWTPGQTMGSRRIFTLFTVIYFRQIFLHDEFMGYMAPNINVFDCVVFRSDQNHNNQQTTKTRSRNNNKTIKKNKNKNKKQSKHNQKTSTKTWQKNMFCLL